MIQRTWLTAVFVVVTSAAVCADEATPAGKTDNPPGPAAAHSRPVNKRVQDFPEKVDLSTPESALAAYNRANVRMDAKAVLGLSGWTGGPREISELEQFWKSKDIAVYNQALLDGEVVEVLSDREDCAVVISKLEFPEGKGVDPYSSRTFGLFHGEWKNLGESRYPSVEAARAEFEKFKDKSWEHYRKILAARDAGRPAPPNGEAPPRSAKIAPGEPLGISAEKAELIGRIEWAFMHGARDITARKTLEYGEIEKNQDGNRTLRYKFEATIWGKDVYTANQVFVFDDQGNVLDMLDVAGYPQKKVVQKPDVSSEEGLKALVEEFFHNNFRDVQARETVGWGSVTNLDNGNVSIGYKYRARIWDGEPTVFDKTFTFDRNGEFVSVVDTAKAKSQK